jgi:hypothetical protein
VSERWRGVVAALLNPDLRAALAEIVGDDALTPARRERAVARLEELGLVARDADGAARFDDGELRAILAVDARPTASGPERYLDGEGRIDRYPVRAADRQELLAWVAQRVLEPEEVLGEAEFNGRLLAFTDDVAALRRHLVDHALVERTRSGSAYARVMPPSA